MVKAARHMSPLSRTLPLRYRGRDQYMKQRIVGSGNGSAKACLLRALRFAICKMVGLLEQVIREGHGLIVNLIFELGLLRDTAEIEVRNETPVPAKIYLAINEVHEGCCCLS